MEDQLKADFPIDWEEDQYVSRREFFKFMTLASGGLALGSVGLAAWAQMSREGRKFEPLRIANRDELQPGTSHPFAYPRPHDICILVCQPDGSLAAFSRRCTHLSCPVEYEPQNQRLYCPCHNGAFSVTDGKVLQGPPPRPLPRIVLEERNGEVWATGVQMGEKA